MPILALLFGVFELVFAYLVPAFAIGSHYGLGWGIVAFIVPLFVFTDSGCLWTIAMIAWCVFVVIACVAVIGWWTVAVVISWILLLAVIIAIFLN